MAFADSRTHLCAGHCGASWECWACALFWSCHTVWAGSAPWRPPHPRVCFRSALVNRRRPCRHRQSSLPVRRHSFVQLISPYTFHLNWERLIHYLPMIINPLTTGVAGAPQMTLRPVSSSCPRSPLPSGTCWTSGRSNSWCYISTSSFVHLVFSPTSPPNSPPTVILSTFSQVMPSSIETSTHGGSNLHSNV